jgi:hypothetical protein
MSNNKVKVFTSYARKDADIKEEFDVHMAMVKRDPIVDIWSDEDIEIGSEWDDSIKSKLLDADVILLLVSPRFLASRYIFDVEITEAMKKHENKEAFVVPIILKPCDWQQTDFAKLQALPRNATPVVQWPNGLDDAFVNVVKGIKQVIAAAQRRKTTE